MSNNPDKLKRNAIITAIILVVSLLCIIILPHFIVGHEEGGQHMGRRTIIDESGNEVVIDEPGIIEYYMVYTPLEEAFQWICVLCMCVAPISAIALIAFLVKFRKVSKS